MVPLTTITMWAIHRASSFRNVSFSESKRYFGSCGLVGLPNVGKSTLFNALTRTQLAEAANYPFCTIEPNKSFVSVPDMRLEKLAAFERSQKITRQRIEMIDIAGLVKGAHKGQGLGNQFLGNIRQAEVVLHVLRCFENEKIVHVDGKISPIDDLQIIETELILSDLERLSQKRDKRSKLPKGARFQLEHLESAVEKSILALNAGKPAGVVKVDSDEELLALKSLDLLSAKPVLFVCNVDEEAVTSGNRHTRAVEDYAKQNTDIRRSSVVVCGKLECDVAQMDTEEERQEFLAEYGLEKTGLDQVVTESAKLLGLKTFYTVGPTGILLAIHVSRVHQ